LNNTEKKIDNTNRLNELNSKENKILKETDGKHTLLLKKAENNSEFNKQNIIEIDKSINKEEIQNKSIKQYFSFLISEQFKLSLFMGIIITYIIYLINFSFITEKELNNTLKNLNRPLMLIFLDKILNINLQTKLHLENKIKNIKSVNYNYTINIK